MEADPILQWICAGPPTVDIPGSKVADSRPTEAIGYPAGRSTFERYALRRWRFPQRIRRIQPFEPVRVPSGDPRETLGLPRPCSTIDPQRGHHENGDRPFEKPC